MNNEEFVKHFIYRSEIVLYNKGRKSKMLKDLCAGNYCYIYNFIYNIIASSCRAKILILFFSFKINSKVITDVDPNSHGLAILAWIHKRTDSGSLNHQRQQQPERAASTHRRQTKARDERMRMMRNGQD